jgi:hypothetical protein
MSSFISDDDMGKLEKSGESKPPVQKRSSSYLSDDEMEKLSPNKSEDSSAGMTALESFGNAATLGYLPHIQAAVQGPMNKALDYVTGNNVGNESLDSYVARRDENIRRIAQQAKDNPKSAMAGTIGGIAASALAAGGAGVSANGATFGARALQGVKTGAALGALANPGDTEGEAGLQLEERAKNAAIGGALGGAAQGVAEGIGKVGSKAAKYFRSKAEERAFKALGPDLRAVRQNMSKDQINSIGRTLIDDGVVNATSSTDDIARNITPAKKDAIEKLESTIESLGKAQKKMNSSGGGGSPGVVPKGHNFGGMRSGVDRKAIAKSLRDDLINTSTEIPGVTAKNAKIEKLIRQFENGGDDLLEILDAEHLKRATGKEIKWDRLPGADIPIEEQVQRSLYTKLKQGVEDGADAIEKVVGGPGAGTFQKAKQKVGQLSEAAKIVEKRQARELANRFISPSDYLTGGLGAATGFASGDSLEDRIGRAALGATLGGANKLMRGYGNQVTAKVLDKTANFLSKGANVSALARRNVGPVQAAVNRTVDGLQGRPMLAVGQDPLLQNPDLMARFKANPELVENIQNPKLKEQIQRAIGRGPSQAKPERQNFADGGEVRTLGQIIGFPGSDPKPPKKDEKKYAKGGPIPGVAKVSGNSEKNDTVPAMLSPGEIVLPRSVTMAKNAPEAAAKFVAEHLKKSSLGPDRWAQNGAEKLGLSAPLAEKLLQSKEGKRLLIEASDLEPGSRAMNRIKEQIQKGYGSK